MSQNVDVQDAWRLAALAEKKQRVSNLEDVSYLMSNYANRPKNI